MVRFLFILIALVSQTEPVPYKPSDEFEVRLEFSFKQRPSLDHYSVKMSETRKEFEQRTSNTPLPYLIAHVEVLKTDASVSRVRIIKNRSTSEQTRKVTPGMRIKLDLGFTDDIKDQTTSNQIQLIFLSTDKKTVDRIEIFFEEDGTYYVNGVKRGKI